MAPKCATVVSTSESSCSGSARSQATARRLSALRLDQRDRLAHRADESSVRLDGAGGDDDLRAVPGERERELPTDAAAGAGDDGDSIVELHVSA